MRYLLKIARREHPQAPRVWETFAYDTDDLQATVATALRDLNAQPELRNLEGNQTTPIVWDNSCLQRKCGACAMVINGLPRLACDTRLQAFGKEAITLEPLAKFPVVADLMVDRKALFDNLARLETWLADEACQRPKNLDVSYEASRCLQCGCCLEVCPNFAVGQQFAGMAALVPLARLLAQTDKDQRKKLTAAYRAGVYGGCGKSLACRNICPAEIPIDQLMARSNAAALWGRFVNKGKGEASQ